MDMGMGGVAAVLARGFGPGESVRLGIHVPNAAVSWRARSLGRHQGRPRCGPEFMGLSTEQNAAIRRFTKKAKPQPDSGKGTAAIETQKLSQGGGSQGKGSEGVSPEPPVHTLGKLPPARLRGRGWIFLLASIVILLAVLRWRWDQGWADLEAGLHSETLESSVQPDARVSAEVMQKLITHRVDPEYPEAARASNLQAVVIAEIVVGSDGSVVSVRPLSGPEVFQQPAVEALRWWRFEPYRNNGRPLAVETTLAVEFKP
jgi:TonB family protein